MDAPIVFKPIPAQVINVGAAFGPLALTEYLGGTEPETVSYAAELSDGSALPDGLICTVQGEFTGIPPRRTEGDYEIRVIAENEAGTAEAIFSLTIKPAFIAAGTAEELDDMKRQVWEALGSNATKPEFKALIDRAITPLDIYYLLERWGNISIYDAFNLEAPGDKVPLTLTGVTEHFVVYDRGSCLVAAPKDLFSYDRTLEDGLKAARALAKEAYERNWVVEIVGFEKYARAAWVEFQHLADKFGRTVEIINYQVSSVDVRVYETQAIARPIIGGGPE